MIGPVDRAEEAEEHPEVLAYRRDPTISDAAEGRNVPASGVARQGRGSDVCGGHDCVRVRRTKRVI
jgi:hypothetical protein